MVRRTAMAGTGDTQVLTRIGFAQRWLDRAKRQCTEGNLTRTALTLVLAGAEVHHAIEATGAPAGVGTRRSTAFAFVLVSAVVASALLLASRWPVTSSAASSPPPRLVRLSSSSGALLEAVGAAGSASRPASPSAAAGGPRSGRVVDAQVASPSATLLGTGHELPLDRTIGTAPIVVGSSHISMSELIDLVLTAERALRQDPAGTSSP